MVRRRERSDVPEVEIISTQATETISTGEEDMLEEIS
jgi:hypothetical protein